MPLKLLVPSISRVNAASSSTSPHPLHGLLEPLLLTPRTAANKYHVELPQILSDGGGAGEIEETMMWFSLNHEKVEDDDWIRSEDANDVDVPWADENWRQKWLERMERRESVDHGLCPRLVLTNSQSTDSDPTLLLEAFIAGPSSTSHNPLT